MTVEILDKAEDDDLVNGFAFYESQQPGLGVYFRESVSADIGSLRIYGGVHRVVYRIYTVSGDTVFIPAVVDCRRKPAWLKEHLR